jgi:hypothetical protein
MDAGVETTARRFRRPDLGLIWLGVMDCPFHLHGMKNLEVVGKAEIHTRLMRREYIVHYHALRSRLHLRFT